MSRWMGGMSTRTRGHAHLGMVMGVVKGWLGHLAVSPPWPNPNYTTQSRLEDPDEDFYIPTDDSEPDAELAEVRKKRREERQAAKKEKRVNKVVCIAYLMSLYNDVCFSASIIVWASN